MDTQTHTLTQVTVTSEMAADVKPMLCFLYILYVYDKHTQI